jgi:hypothetical protein
VGSAELGAGAVCSILLGMNALGRKSILLYFVFYFFSFGCGEFGGKGVNPFRLLELMRLVRRQFTPF